MASLHSLTELLDSELSIASIPDYPGAVNGLQLENSSGRIARIIAAVDACEPVIEQAARADGPVLLIVHHGLFWSGVQPMRGPVFRKTATAIRAGMAIYSAHIPLDVHPRHGNNAQLAAALGLRRTTPFFPWKGIQLGVCATVSMTRETLVQRCETALGGPLHLCPGGPAKIRGLGIITGGAGSEIAAAAAAGIDTFLTGEGPHWSYTAAEELGVNLLYGGHYATETFGVKAVAAWLSARTRLPWSFLDHPTGL